MGRALSKGRVFCMRPYPCSTMVTVDWDCLRPILGWGAHWCIGARGSGREGPWPTCDVASASFNGLMSVTVFDILLTLLIGQIGLVCGMLFWTMDWICLNTLVVVPCWGGGPPKEGSLLRHTPCLWHSCILVIARSGRHPRSARAAFPVAISPHHPPSYYAGPPASFPKRNVTAHLVFKIYAEAEHGRDCQPWKEGITSPGCCCRRSHTDQVSVEPKRLPN